jgi:ActR/RegA family two-component response regulator
MARILVVEENAGALETIRQPLQAQGHTVRCAASGRAALRIATSFCPEVALVDNSLADMTGLDVIRMMRLYGSDVSCAIMARGGTIASAVEAIRAGAFDYLEKPIVSDRLLKLVEQATSSTAHRAPESHALARWTHVIVGVIRSPSDLRTLHAWSRSAGVSTGALRNWCRAARLPARRSLLFARVLRAVVLREQDASCRPEDLLDVVDHRTFGKLLRAGGGTNNELPSLATFLARQQFIASADAVRQVSDALRLLRRNRDPQTA